jgi:hypothetical protein
MSMTYCIAAWITATALVQEPIGKSQESTDTIELSRLENIWNDAHTQGNANTLNSLWADDLIVTVPTR